MTEPLNTAGFHKLVRSHIPALDGLRGIAILLVLAHSYAVIETGEGPGRRVEIALDLGWIGVQLFFVLSGFLITGILLETRRSATYFRTFFLRRVFRIFPLYYAVLLVAFVIAPLVTTMPPGHGDHQIWLWTYTSNFAAPFGRGEAAFPHFWSLGVEEQFYILWPIVVWLASRRGVIVVGIVVTGLAIALRVIVREQFGPDATYMFLPCRMDALAIGAIAAAVIRGGRVGRALGSVAPTVLAMVGGALVLGGAALGHLLRTGQTMQTFGYTILALGFALVVLACLETSALPSRLLGFAPLRRIGLYSYGMYVFHAPLHNYVGMPLLTRLDPAPGGLAGLLYLGVTALVTFLLAAVSFHVFERPFLRLKDRFAPQSPR